MSALSLDSLFIDTNIIFIQEEIFTRLAWRPFPLVLLRILVKSAVIFVNVVGCVWTLVIIKLVIRIFGLFGTRAYCAVISNHDSVRLLDCVLLHLLRVSSSRLRSKFRSRL